MRAEVPHLPAHAKRHMQRGFSEALTQTMRDVRTRRLALAAGALSRTAPLAKRQLLLIYFHLRDRREGV